MPTRAPKPCAWPGCPELIYSIYCPTHERASERRRGSAHARGYTYRWHKASRAFLELRPLCADPYGLHGEIPAPAEVVDHVVPHRGDERLFWDRGNSQPLCRSCHSRKTALEDGGFGRG